MNSATDSMVGTSCLESEAIEEALLGALEDRNVSPKRVLKEQLGVIFSLRI